MMDAGQDCDQRQRLGIGCGVDQYANERAKDDRVARLFVAASRHPLQVACGFPNALISELARARGLNPDRMGGLHENGLGIRTFLIGGSLGVSGI